VSPFVISSFAVKASEEVLACERRPQSLGEEIANSVSHGLGFVAALIAAPILITAAAARASSAFFIGTSIFVATIWLLYLCSTFYHAWPQTPLKRVWRVIDHSAIFLLIAGTYSPLTLGPLHGWWGWTIFCLIWILALVGVSLKFLGGITRPKWSIALYLTMGWLILIAIRPLAAVVPGAAVAWLVAGGIAYTGGIIFYINERVRYCHFVWHLFVLAGTCCHFCAIFSCIA